MSTYDVRRTAAVDMRDQLREIMSKMTQLDAVDPQGTVIKSLDDLANLRFDPTAQKLETASGKNPILKMIHEAGAHVTTAYDAKNAADMLTHMTAGQSVVSDAIGALTTIIRRA